MTRPSGTGTGAATVRSGGPLPSGMVGPPEPFPADELELPAAEAAPRLLGALLVRTTEAGDRVVARIVETEAYRQDDPASHSFAGRTARTRPMFERPGTAYVYRSYGIHWCLNVTAEPAGTGAAVLVRAAAVLEGVEQVRRRRPTAGSDAALLRGPGNLAAGLDVDAGRHDGADLLRGQARLALVSDGWRPDDATIAVGPRVGVSQAAATPWRFHVVGAAEVSAYRRSPRAAEASTG